MYRAVIPLLIIVVLSIFGYSLYSRKQTVLKVGLEFGRMAEKAKNYNEVSKGLTTEQDKKMQLIRDSIESINSENLILNRLVADQKLQIQNLRDSLYQIEKGYNEYVDKGLSDIQRKFDKFKEETLKENAIQIASLTEESSGKDQVILSLQQELILKNQQIDSLNTLIMSKNSHIIELTNKIHELQSYISKVNVQLPLTFQSIENINKELLYVHDILNDSNIFNRKKRMGEARNRIKRIIDLYEQLNNTYETEYFNSAINELASLDVTLDF